MVWKKRVFAIATRVLLVAILSGLMVSPALGQQPERVKVLIGFMRQPGPAEEALVRGVSGTIRYTYHLVPAIAATVPERAIDGLRRNPNVTNVDLDGQVWAVDTELDNAWGVKRIGAGSVHDSGNKGLGVKVAIIDSGIDYNHPDLDANYAGGYDFVDGDDDPMDVYGHGTHVAGTACAEDNDNGIDDSTGKFGVVGVAPQCALYSLRVLNDDGAGSWSAIIAAMEWAVDNGMQVVNLSLGSSRDPGGTVKAAFDSAETAGVVIVAAAGNSGNPPGKGNNVIYPAKYDSVIAVAATDSSDERASFSSTGDQVELAAPGVSVFSTWNDNDSPHNPQPVCHTEEDKQACYKDGSGTSMASPHVAGTAALVLAANPGWTNDQVRTQLHVTADDLGAAGRDPQYGFGLVDADEAAPPPVGNRAPLADAGPDQSVKTGSTVQLDGSNSSDPDGDPITYSWAFVSKPTDSTATLSGADTATPTFVADVDGTYEMELTVSDGELSSSDSVVVTAAANRAPVADAGPDQSVKTGSTVQLDGSNSFDPDGDPITYSWTFVSRPADSTATLSGADTATPTFVADVDGTYEMGLTVSDGELSSSDSVVVTGATATEATAVIVTLPSGTDGYTTEGGRDGKKHLSVTIALVDDFGDPVAGAFVSIRLDHESGSSWTSTGTTGTDGTVTFSLKNAPSGCYTTTVDNVTAEGLTWDNATPENEFCK